MLPVIVMQGSLRLAYEAFIGNIIELILLGIFGVLTYYVRGIHSEWETRAKVLDQLDKMVNGMEENNHFEGLVEVIEGHDEELDEHQAKLSEIKMTQKHNREKQQEIEERLSRLKDKKANRKRLHRLEDQVND